MSAFVKARKDQRPLKMALFGPSGGGKTYTSLRIAQVFANGGRVALIDTERGSASLYSDEFDFDTAQLTSYSVDDYVRLISEADKAGYAVIVIDSVSHAWEAAGGILEVVENIKKTKNYKDSMRAWADVKPIENRLWDAILDARASVIVTMRAKTAYEISRDDRGKTTVEKLGLAPIQRADKEYEFDVVGRMENAELVIVKTRCKALTALPVYNQPGAEFAGILKTWLADGAEPTAPQTVTKPAPAAHKPEPPEPPEPDSAEPAAETMADHKAQMRALCERMGAPLGCVVDYIQHHTGKRKMDDLDEETRMAILTDWAAKAELVREHEGVVDILQEALETFGGDYKNIHCATAVTWRKWLGQLEEVTTNG